MKTAVFKNGHRYHVRDGVAGAVRVYFNHANGAKFVGSASLGENQNAGAAQKQKQQAGGQGPGTI